MDDKYAKENLNCIRRNREDFSKAVPKSEVEKEKEKCIELEIKVKDPVELEHLKMDVECGLFMKRYVAWMKENGGIIDESQNHKVQVIADGNVVATFEPKMPSRKPGAVLIKIFCTIVT